MTIVIAYCDGSISNAVMLDPFQSRLSEEYVGRMIVLIPTCDLGLIEQTRSGILTNDGAANSTVVEEFAIRKAIEFCMKQEFGDFVIYSDCDGAIAKVNDPRICWASREDMYLPNAYFDRMLRRAAYLRGSAREVKKRKLAAIHQEIFDLFQAERQEFRLSKSLLWAEISQ